MKFHPATSSYRIPSVSFSSCFEDVVRKAKNFYPPDKLNMSLIVRGEINFPDSDWSSMYSSNKRELEFLEYLYFLELLPLITTGQTHRCGNVLDNIVTNNNFITGYSIEDNSLSYHSSIIVNYSSEFNKPYQHPTEYSFNDHTDMMNFHNSREYFSFTSYPSEANVNEFYSFVSWSLNTCFPFKRKVRINNFFYYSSHIIHCLNKLNTARRKYSKNPIKNSLDSLQSLQMEFSDSVELDKIIYINGSSTSSLNQCFSLLNSLKNTSLPKQMFLSQEKLLDSDIPTALNEYFAGNFNFNSYDGSVSTYGAQKLDFVFDFVSRSSITYDIMRTKESTVSTFDGFPNKLPVSAPVLFGIIFYPLFCSIILCKVFPSVWKVARITLVFKFGSRKIFDKDRHSILLRKLSLYLDYEFCSLFETYLMNRYQYVYVNDFSSDLLPCVSGVPRGSVFSPCVFLIFVDDLPSIFLDCMVWLFADDLKLLFSNLNFHDDFWRLYSWNLINGMMISFDKTKCLHFSGTAQITFPPDLLLENVNSHKDLGVYVAYDLKWNLHVTKKLHKARQSFFALKSKVPFNTPSIIKLQLYHSMVLSILLYGFPAWYPDITSLKRLESFQRSCFS